MRVQGWGTPSLARAECPSERGERFKRLGLSKETLTALVSRGFAATASIASSLGCSHTAVFQGLPPSIVLPTLVNFGKDLLGA